MNNVFEATYFLTAGECDARGQMPITLIADRLIEVASLHANSLDFGYSRLAPLGQGWVLSKIGVQMLHLPGINQYYKVSTWVETWNRLYSERCFRFEDLDGNILGWGRSVWAIIDVHTRRAVDMTDLIDASALEHSMTCPMPRMRPHIVTEPTRTLPVAFHYSDLDFNRHVNSVMYIRKIIDAWTPAHYDKYRILRFEIAYKHECHPGETIEMRIEDTVDGSVGASIAMVRRIHGDVNADQVVVTAQVEFLEEPI